MICCRCGRAKPLAEFPEDRRTRSGRCGCCTTCRSERRRRWRRGEIEARPNWLDWIDPRTGEVPRKACGRCDEVKPASAFSLLRGARTGRSSYCRACQRKLWHARYGMQQAPDAVLTEAEKAYIAGILDGEGYVTVLHSRSQTLSVNINNNNEALMRWLTERVGGRYYARRPAKRASFHFQWSISSRMCRWLLPQVLPYLIVKRRHAELLLEADRLKRELHLNEGLRSSARTDSRMVQLFRELHSLSEKGRRSRVLG